MMLHEHERWQDALLCPTCIERREADHCTRCGKVPKTIAAILQADGGLFNGSWCWPCSDAVYGGGLTG